MEETKVASIKNVALRAGVSISTVSNALSGAKYVSPALKARVMRAVSDTGYQANALARGLKSGITMTLGVIVPSIVSVFFPRVLRGMQLASAEAGYLLSIFETGEDASREKRHIELLKSQMADGILLSTSAEADDAEYFDSLSRLEYGGKRIPVVCFESEPSGLMDAVSVDNVSAAREAVSYLAGIGRRYIAHIGAPRRFIIGTQRREGYEAALVAAGLPVIPALVREGDYTPSSGFNAMQSLLRERETASQKLDAVFCGNDQMAVGAMRAILDAGLRVPQDIAVMGFDNSFPASLVEPSLSSVAVPQQKLGAEAARLLIWRIAAGDGEAKRRITLETRIVERRSTVADAMCSWELADW